MSRDIRRKKPTPPPPAKPKKKKAPAVPPAPKAPKAPSQVMGYVHKADEGGWLGYIGDEDAAIILLTIETPVKRMKDVVEWINIACDKLGLELKEIVKLA